ncbi:hypothetical protein N9B72_00290 [Bacteriovoracaceae bacterium]|nr:hypothetical protein [Bacteriovoracaceae bacterium]
MKKILGTITICLILLNLSFADDHILKMNNLDGYNKIVKDHIIKIKYFLQKKKKCHVGLIEMYDYFKKANHLGYFPGSILCIADIASREGTIHEKSGCSLTYLDINNGSYKPFKYLGGIPISSKSCLNGGFEELIKLEGEWSISKNKGSVEDVIFERYSNKSLTNIHLLYSSNTKFKDWYVSLENKFYKTHLRKHRILMDKKKKNEKLMDVKNKKKEIQNQKKAIIRKLKRKTKKKKFNELFE